MSAQARRKIAQGKAVPLRLASPHELCQSQQELHELIALRAFEMFEKRGRQHGQDVSDWLQAESEILHQCRHDVRERPDSFLIRGELPGGFTPDQIKVSVEPRRVIVSGEALVSGLYCDGVTTETRPRVRRILRIHDLPAEVDTSNCKATLEGQQLEITLPKAKRAVEQVKTG